VEKPAEESSTRRGYDIPDRRPFLLRFCQSKENVKVVSPTMVKEFCRIEGTKKTLFPQRNRCTQREGSLKKDCIRK